MKEALVVRSKRTIIHVQGPCIVCRGYIHTLIVNFLIPVTLMTAFMLNLDRSHIILDIDRIIVLCFTKVIIES